jgi:hypothetical protein
MLPSRVGQLRINMVRKFDVSRPNDAIVDYRTISDPVTSTNATA